MAKRPKFYAVVHGRKLGIFDKWEDGARLSIERFPEAKHQSFVTLELAEEWYRQNSPAKESRHSPVFYFCTSESPAPARPDADCMDGKRYVVYLIIDPLTDEPFYVGQTSNLERRQKAHLLSAKHDTKRAATKIAEILDAGLSPIFKVVESCSSEAESLSAETLWVKRCAQRGYKVWNRWIEHRQTQAIYLRPKIDVNQIIGDGPIRLGRYSYASRLELKNKLEAFLAKSPLGVITHPVAIEKLTLIWQQSGQSDAVQEFQLVSGAPAPQLEALLLTGKTMVFLYKAAIDQLL